MVQKRSPSQEPILPPSDSHPLDEEEPQIRPDWHTLSCYDNPYLSGLYGAVGGILSGGALLGILWYFYGIEFLLSVYITGSVAVVLIIGMSLSVACRCIVGILVPELLGKYGRWVLYSLMLASLVAGPVSNISTNMERMSSSMSCSMAMIKNQTQDLKQQFLDPFNSIKEEVVRIEEKIRLYASVIESAMKPITEAISATASGIKDAANYLKKAADDCEKMFNSAYNSCNNFFSKAYKKCKSAIDQIPVIGSLRRRRNAQGEIVFIEDVLVHWNEMDDEKHRKIWETRAEEILEETLEEYATLYPDHEVQEPSLLKEKYLNMTVRRFKRGAVSAICDVVNIAGSICAPLKLTSGICTPLKTLSDALSIIGTGLSKLYETIKNAFYFNIIKKWYLIGVNDISKTAAAMIAEMASYFPFHSYIITTTLSILTQWTSLLLIAMLLNSALYLQHYLTHIDFDNNYITLNFRRFDRDCRRLSRPSALPLEKNETSQYIFTSSMALNGSEIKRSILAILQMLLNIIFYAIVVFFDYVFYYVVYLVHTYGNVQIDFSGSIRIYFAITGDGMIANLLQGLVTGINIKDTYYTKYNVTQCLPNPSYPDNNNLYLIMALYGGVLATILLQSYCYRLKQALCGFFYQKREEERIRYLHNKILHHRQFKLQQMQLKLRNSKQAQDAQNSLASLPLIGRIFRFHDNSDQRSCLHCGISDGEGQHFYTCSRASCYTDYCEDCFNEMGKQCLLCSKDGQKKNRENLAEGFSLHNTSPLSKGKHNIEGWRDTLDTLPLLHDSGVGIISHRGQDNPAFSDDLTSPVSSEGFKPSTTTDIKNFTGKKMGHSNEKNLGSRSCQGEAVSIKDENMASSRSTKKGPSTVTVTTESPPEMQTILQSLQKSHSVVKKFPLEMEMSSKSNHEGLTDVTSKTTDSTLL